MALGKSIKMYLTIFVATTCVYMVLYQYHISREPMPSPEAIKSKSLSASESAGSGSARGDGASSGSLIKRYNRFLWSPLSLWTSHSSTRQSSSSPSLSSSLLATPQPSSSLSSSSSPSSPSSSSVAPAAATSSRSTSTTRTTADAPETSNSNHNNSNKTNSTNNNNTNANETATASSPSSSTVVATPTTTTTVTPTTSTTVESAEAPPPLYIITPTYRRPEQLAELTRLGYTLKHVANLLWLVIEDANRTSELVTSTLNRIGVPYEYLVAPMPEEYKKTKKAKPRGVSNRNRGLQWLRQNATEGVFYFADDDNTYDLSIFEEMRYTKKVSMWPVGLVTKYGVSSPIIRNGKIDGFYDGWIGGRKYPVDMAGFAVSVKFLHERPDAKMPFKPGYEEDGFLKSLAPLNNTEIELLASNCTEILTWHTQTKKNAPAQPLNMTKYGGTNLVTIDTYLIRT